MIIPGSRVQQHFPLLGSEQAVVSIVGHLNHSASSGLAEGLANSRALFLDTVAGNQSYHSTVSEMLIPDL